MILSESNQRKLSKEKLSPNLFLQFSYLMFLLMPPLMFYTLGYPYSHHRNIKTFQILFYNFPSFCFSMVGSNDSNKDVRGVMTRIVCVCAFVCVCVCKCVCVCVCVCKCVCVKYMPSVDSLFPQCDIYPE